MVCYSHRYNNSIKRDQIIVELAKQVGDLGEHIVDLSGGAKKTIIVELVKSVCCLSVVEDYGRFYKFNLLSVCGRPENQKRTKESEHGNNTIYIFIKKIITVTLLSNDKKKNSKLL